eukprot:scaffold39215_cov42-Phaeocystis_antarctica.AAC.2
MATRRRDRNATEGPPAPRSVTSRPLVSKKESAGGVLDDAAGIRRGLVAALRAHDAAPPPRCSRVCQRRSCQLGAAGGAVGQASGRRHQRSAGRHADGGRALDADRPALDGQRAGALGQAGRHARGDGVRDPGLGRRPHARGREARRVRERACGRADAELPQGGWAGLGGDVRR